MEDAFDGSPIEDRRGAASIRPQRAQTSSEEEIVGVEEVMVQAQVHNEESDQADTAWESLDETSTPTQQQQRAKKHVNSERKLIDWDLTVQKKWLIIGDSNLSRIPGYDIPDLQIDSYPGANFRHAEALIRKATSRVTVERVVLSFGLNHRNQKARETSIRQLQGAVWPARRKFPYADIWVPIMNFSPALSKIEKQTLITLNDHIEKNMPGLSALEDGDFHTEKDNVHWTKRTARAMLQHWATLLNLTAL